MKNLFESGINQEILNELKTALQMQQSDQIELGLKEIIEEFTQRGYSEKELTVKVNLRTNSSELICSLTITVSTPDTAEKSFSTKTVRIKPDYQNSKSFNTTAKKILDFYAEKAQKEIEETNLAIISSTANDLKTTWYNSKNNYYLSVKGLKFYMSSYFYSNSFTEEIRIEEFILNHINSLVEERENVEKEKELMKKMNEIAEKENLRKWGMINGSELLKTRIELDLDWIDLANEEYIDSIIPEGFYYDENDYEEIRELRDPSLKQMNELREARTIKDLQDVRIIACTDDDDSEYHFISGFVKSLNGKNRTEVVKPC